MADLELDVDILNGGTPADATASRWHVTPLGITVTTTTPPDCRIPCRLHLHATDAQRWLGQTLTLSRAAPVRETWLRARLVDFEDNPRPIIVLDYQVDGTITVHRTPEGQRQSRKFLPTRTGPDARHVAHIVRAYPAVRADAHQWLTDDATLADLLADIIRHGLDRERRDGPRRHPTPDAARADLRQLTDAARAHIY
jgi:hypothetical protein